MGAKAGVVECASALERSNALAHGLDEGIGQLARDEEALDADAVLAHRLEAGAEEHRGEKRNVGSWQNHGRILTAQFKRRSGQLRRGSKRDGAPDAIAADERDMRQTGVPRDGLGMLRRTHHELDEVLRQIAGGETAVHAEDHLLR